MCGVYLNRARALNLLILIVVVLILLFASAFFMLIGLDGETANYTQLYLNLCLVVVILINFEHVDFNFPEVPVSLLELCSL